MSAATQLNPAAEERRGYFRINERAMLGLRVMEEGELAEGIRAIEQGGASRDGVDDLLLSIDAQLQQQLAGISAHDASVASALALMNRKLNVLERMVRTVVTDPDDAGGRLPEYVVNLSAGGFAVEAREPMATDARIEVEMVLLPSYRYLRCIGRVVECRASDEQGGYYRIAVEFEAIRDVDRDLLVQHVFSKQSLALRAARSLPDIPGL